MKNIIADTIFELSDLLYRLHTEVSKAQRDNVVIEGILSDLRKNFDELLMFFKPK